MTRSSPGEALPHPPAIARQAPTAKSAGSATVAQPTADLIPRQVISTGDVVLTAHSVAAARQRIIDALATWHGVIVDEQTSNDTHGQMTRTHFELRVPNEQFQAAIDGLAGLAHLVNSSQSSQDVTTQVIDTDARVRAKQAAVRQLEALLGRANTLGQVVELEGDISARQAELQSLKQQQAWLTDQTAMSTIEVDLSRTPKAVIHHVHHARHHDHAGLVAGLRAGWRALGVVMTGVLTVVGTVAPFAAVLAVVGLPVWLIWRRRHLAGAPAAE